MHDATTTAVSKKGQMYTALLHMQRGCFRILNLQHSSHKEAILLLCQGLPSQDIR